MAAAALAYVVRGGCTFGQLGRNLGVVCHVRLGLSVDGSHLPFPYFDYGHLRLAPSRTVLALQHLPRYVRVVAFVLALKG